MFDVNGRLSDHLLERASEGPRSKRQMFCPAPVMDCSCVNFTPSRKSVLRTNRQADRLRNHAGSPASLGQSPKRALLYLPAQLDTQEWRFCVAGSVQRGHRGAGRLCTLGDEAGGIRAIIEVPATQYVVGKGGQSRFLLSERVWGACLEEVPLELLKSR